MVAQPLRSARDLPRLGTGSCETPSTTGGGARGDDAVLGREGRLQRLNAAAEDRRVRDARDAPALVRGRADRIERRLATCERSAPGLGHRGARSPGRAPGAPDGSAGLSRGAGGLGQCLGSAAAGAPGDEIGDSMECRLRQAEHAIETAEPATHCPGVPGWRRDLRPGLREPLRAAAAALRGAIRCRLRRAGRLRRGVAVDPGPRRLHHRQLAG